MISRRLTHRMLRHHLPIGLATLAAGYLLYSTRSFPDVLTRLSFSSAYPALVLLTATLLIGPLKILVGRRLAVSMDFRRDIGIWAGLVGLFHVWLGSVCICADGPGYIIFTRIGSRNTLCPCVMTYSVSPISQGSLPRSFC